MDIKELFKVVAPGVDDDLVKFLRLSAENEFKAYTDLKIIPRTASTLIVKMMHDQFTRQGIEHLKSQTYGNVSETFRDSYSEGIYSELNAYKRKVWAL